MKAEAKGFFAVVVGALGLFLARRVVLARAFFRVTNLIINPSTVPTGGTVDISVTITNIGRQPGTKQVRLRVISTIQKEITLNPRESGVLTFSLSPEVAGTYNVRVDGLAGRFTVTAPEPAPIEGGLFTVWGAIGEFEDVSAFPYHIANGSIAYIHIESKYRSKDLPIPENPMRDLSGFVKIALTDRQTLWIACGNPIKVHKYIIGENELLLVSTNQFGDTNSRLRGFIRLHSGKLILMWSQQVNECPVGYAYTDNLEVWIQPDYIQLGGQKAIEACICQHPADGKVWWFSTADGWNGLKMIRLVEQATDIAVEEVNPDFIRFEDTPDPNMRPCNELPFVTAVADPSTNSILVAFQNGNFKMFSVDPFCKGAHLSVISVRSNGVKQLELALPKWVERSQPFLLGLDATGKIWLAYTQIDEAECTANDLYINNEPIGELMGGAPCKAGITFCNSQKYVIATMSDGYIRFFKV